jgi:hypothetical protein
MTIRPDHKSAKQLEILTDRINGSHRDKCPLTATVVASYAPMQIKYTLYLHLEVKPLYVLISDTKRKGTE